MDIEAATWQAMELYESKEPTFQSVLSKTEPYLAITAAAEIVAGLSLEEVAVIIPRGRCRLTIGDIGAESAIDSMTVESVLRDIAACLIWQEMLEFEKIEREDARREDIAAQAPNPV